MKTRKLYGDKKIAAERIFETLYEIMVEANLYALDSDQIALDYMDVQAIRNLVERAHDFSTYGLKTRCKNVFESLIIALQNDFDSNKQGYIVIVRSLLTEIMEVLGLYYALHPNTPLDAQMAKVTEIEYWVDPDTEYEMVEIRLPDGTGDIVRYDDVIHSPFWLIIYQDIKQHERMGMFAEAREHYSLMEWFRHVIQNHYFIKDNIPDSVHQGDRYAHNPEA